MRTRTAKLADWHIAIRPGTDCALALAMMHILIKEGLIDRDYVAKYTVGYDELAERVEQYTPEFASKETGVSVADLYQLTREYAMSAPAVIRIGVAVERHAGGGQTVRSIACLPALIGAWRHVGGGLLQLPIWAFPVNWGGLMRPDLQPAKMRVINTWRLGAALTGEMQLDLPIRSLFVYNANPMSMVSEQQKLEAGARPRGSVHRRQRSLHHRHRALRRHHFARRRPSSNKPTSCSPGAISISAITIPPSRRSARRSPTRDVPPARPRARLR